MNWEQISQQDSEMQTSYFSYRKEYAQLFDIMQLYT